MCHGPAEDLLAFPAQPFGEDGDTPLCLDLELIPVRESPPWVDHERSYFITCRPDYTLGINDQPAALGGEDVEVMEIAMHQLDIFYCK